MIKNYFKIAWRNMRKHKTHTIINILGLAIAFICSILLLLSVYHEFSFDNFHQHKDRVFKLYQFDNLLKGTDLSPAMGYPVATYLAKEDIGIEKVTRIKSGGREIRYKAKSLDVGTTLVDPDFFDIFSFNITAGQGQSPLGKLEDVVINQQTANSLFAKENPIGKAVEIKIAGEWKRLIVSAVMADAPTNSTFKFSALARTEIDPNWVRTKAEWYERHHNIYVRLAPHVSQVQVEKQLRLFFQKHVHPDAESLKRDGYLADANGDYLGMRLLSLKDLHFNSELGSGDTVSKTYLFILFLVSVIILFIACFNYINIQISLSFTRNKELGVRKCLGAASHQVWGQLFSENFLQIFIALCLGLIGTFTLIKILVLHNLLQLDSQSLYHPQTLISLFAILIFISLASSSYPFFVLNKLKTTEIFKGKFSLIKSGIGRNTLITLQFITAIILICSTLVCYLQFQHLRTAQLGYNTASIISIPIKDAVNGRSISAKLRTRLTSNPAVISVSGGDVNLGIGEDGGTSRSQVGFKHEGRNIQTSFISADYDFLKTLSITPLEGRDFSTAFVSDSTYAVVITQSMAKQLGKPPLLGRLINTDSTGRYGWQIIGIIPDFHLYSMHEETKPLTIVLEQDTPIDYIFVKVNTQNPQVTMEQIKRTYTSLEPDAEFKGTYVDENVERWYKNEKRLATLFSVAAGIAILLSCMGLFGLALTIINQQVKEIGIRKVLGASIAQIANKVIQEFLKPVFVAFLIAGPIAWWIMNSWLEDFIYRITIPLWIFPLSGLIALLIALLTVGIQSLKAARANPVDSLRSE
ncbi:ABC transporter permease [Olivibacter sp. SDN3]|uniref:ABC transporter permease n=1 Tax=Olivibacter sp. SDN3 TaxID=2764720 RepID=UPI0016511811|nr:ABC transporter permease [Olivibacter sp. SDN3]QNL50947.1 ABC transporter permease [Olivibacter sp. SDN3]